jgi:2,4-dienoyl-CoA reductase-like NADH-dependent reductase (Old Yellow Enzyme family)
VPDPFAPGELGPVTLRNRVIKAATYEGMCPNGVPSPALAEHHAALADGGVGMTTVAYCAVSSDARTFAEQMWMHEGVLEPLHALTRRVHEGGAKASIQLSHAGHFSKVRPADGGWPRGPSRAFNKYGIASGLPIARAMRPEEIAAIPEEFASAALRAEQAGFDAIELHLGHGYLLSQFLSPASNHRRDEWGGSLENRMRLPLAVFEKVRQAVGGRLAITAKLNTSDGIRRGFEIEEALEVAAALDRAGIDGIITTGGFLSVNPLYLFRGERPLKQMIAVEKSRFQRVALRVFGPAVLKAYPFEETFFRPAGLRILERVSCPVILLGGVVSRDNLHGAMKDGFEFVQMGRALIADPDLIPRMQRGEAERTRCNACNQCIAAMDAGGVRCVLDDPGGVLSLDR